MPEGLSVFRIFPSQNNPKRMSLSASSVSLVSEANECEIFQSSQCIPSTMYKTHSYENGRLKAYTGYLYRQKPNTTNQ